MSLENVGRAEGGESLAQKQERILDGIDAIKAEGNAFLAANVEYIDLKRGGWSWGYDTPDEVMNEWHRIGAAAENVISEAISNGLEVDSFGDFFADPSTMGTVEAAAVQPDVPEASNSMVESGPETTAETYAEYQEMLKYADTLEKIAVAFRAYADAHQVKSPSGNYMVKLPSSSVEVVVEDQYSKILAGDYGNIYDFDVVAAMKKVLESEQGV
ncbi:hypothetical protein KC902_01120 [Candidatus Kaiserbacteria bacterium]|nr:hypothetical protein [Candidatus Kaiserbacteria bacterium]USN88356.1 MAG: hypothetical protein H6780_02540 [Candidatus Nomurabacteria bacterium]